MQCMAALAKLDKKHDKAEKERIREVKRATGDYMKSVNQANATAKTSARDKKKGKNIQIISSD
jgi:hypothetical protein